MIAATFARIFFRNALNIGLPIVECAEAAQRIEAGDTVEIDANSGRIINHTKGELYQAEPFPPSFRSWSPSVAWSPMWHNVCGRERQRLGRRHELSGGSVPGDGIGPEVVAQGVEILRQAAAMRGGS